VEEGLERVLLEARQALGPARLGYGHERVEDGRLVREGAARKGAVVPARDDLQPREDLVCVHTQEPVNSEFRARLCIKRGRERRTVRSPPPAGRQARHLPLALADCARDVHPDALGRLGRLTNERLDGVREPQDEVARREEGEREKVEEGAVERDRLDEDGSLGAGDGSSAREDVAESSQKGVDLLPREEVSRANARAGGLDEQERDRDAPGTVPA